METQDPDDYITLLLLLGHPMVCVKAITLVPGSPKQVGLVRRTLEEFGKTSIPVGSFDINHPKDCVSPWHERAYGKITPSRDSLPAGKLLADLCNLSTILITGGPNKNLGAALTYPHFILGTWVAQGGFAGEGVVPTELQLDKFKGKKTCATYNFGGAPQDALHALHDERIHKRRLVSKNVCHGVVYDQLLHQRVREVALQHDKQSLTWIYKGMDQWLRKNGSKERITVENWEEFPSLRLIGLKKESLGVMPSKDALAISNRLKASIIIVSKARKPVVCQLREENPAEIVAKKLHDPLAACCAIDPTIGTWEKVDLFRRKNEWGSSLNPESSTSIITSINLPKFHSIFLQTTRGEDLSK